MNHSSPFAVLGISPTPDMVVVKQAYFAALARHPPQRDPEGFQRLRRAYEELLRPGGLRSAYMNAPLDLAAEQARYAALLSAQQEPPEQSKLPPAAQFFDAVQGLDLEAALKRFAG